MKTPYNFAVSLLLLTALTQSCKEKNDAAINDTTEVTAVDTASAIENDTVTTSVSESAQSTSAETPTSTGIHASNTRSSTAPGNRAPGANKPTTTQGYSAPDGTDAENHDGDQYTKNDQRRMPTGTAIK